MNILKSVRFKLTFIALFSVAIVISLVVFSDIRDTRARLLDSQKQKSVILSDLIKHTIMSYMLGDRCHEVQAMIDDYTKVHPELKEIRIFDPVTGIIVFSAESKDIGERIHEEDWDKFIRGDESPFVIKKNKDIFTTRVVPILNSPSCYRCHGQDKNVLGVLDVEVSLAAAQRSILESTYRHLTGLFVGLIIVSLVFLIGGRRYINRPLRNITDVMEKVEGGDLSARVIDVSDDEFGYLSKAFNKMTASLEEANKQLELCHISQIEKTSRLATLGEIISGITHEIKNPLAGISLAMQIIYADLPEGDSKRAVVAEVLNQVGRLDRIIKDLLSYARPKPPHFTLTKIDDVIEKSLFFIYPEAKKQQVVIETEVQKDIPPLMIDPEQMQQVLLNILINSLHAMPAGGLIMISASLKFCSKVADIKMPDCEKALIISISDTGRGIMPEDIHNIFEPFFTKKSKGTGLGLSISRKIVQDHGGEIAVKSEVGKGSAFTVYLPIKTDQRQ